MEKMTDTQISLQQAYDFCELYKRHNCVLQMGEKIDSLLNLS